LVIPNVRVLQGGRLMQRLPLLYPFLFVVLPILNVLTGNAGGSSLADIGILAGVMLAACAAVYAAISLGLGARRRPLVPLIVLAAVLWFYGYEALRWSYRFSRGDPAMIAVTATAVVVAAAGTIAVVWWLARRPPYLDRVNRFFALTGLLLVAWSGARITVDQVRARSALRNSALAKDLAKPLVNDTVALARTERHPDIYLIILDEYANSSVLRERFGFDNRLFENSLRRLGFTVPGVVRSNYVHTLLSLPSLLNFTHLTRLAGELGPEETDPTLPDFLVEHNRTAAFLKAQGYRFLFFPSQWWISTQHNRNADWEFQAWTGFRLDREATRSDMRRAFVGTTPLGLLRRDYAHDADHVKRTLAGLEQVAVTRGPKFVLAHLINPHHPCVLDSNCRTLRRMVGARSPGWQDAYVDQVQCLNRLLLRVVTTLLQRSSTPPVILLVGDHGTNSLRYSSATSAEAVSPAQARERFGAFGAFHLPGDGDRLFADSVTLVNVIPKVLNHYFGAGIPLAPDSLYMSLERTPYLLVPVDAASLADRL
jgi:hypothetical protein